MPQANMQIKREIYDSESAWLRSEAQSGMHMKI